MGAAERLEQEDEDSRRATQEEGFMSKLKFSLLLATENKLLRNCCALLPL